jgi:gliding motility-associated-like protein
VQVNLANCENHLWIPDAFTPDGDGLNDVYEIIGSPFPLHLTVFDRWGSVVFDGEDYQNDWDGTYPSGEPVPEGVYSYHLRYYTSEFGGQKSRFGSLQVFRTR